MIETKNLKLLIKSLGIELHGIASLKKIKELFTVNEFNPLNLF